MTHLDSFMPGRPLAEEIDPDQCLASVHQSLDAIKRFAEESPESTYTEDNNLISFKVKSDSSLSVNMTAFSQTLADAKTAGIIAGHEFLQRGPITPVVTDQSEIDGVQITSTNSESYYIYDVKIFLSGNSPYFIQKGTRGDASSALEAAQQ